jgi:hypothetical protein
LRIAVASGHGIGKSALVGMMLTWAMSTCPETRIVVTANTEGQLRTKTWPEIAKWVRLASNADWWQVPAMSMYENDHEKSWRADAVPWSEQHRGFAGLHNEGKRIVLIYDEASGIADKIWEVSEGALTDANTEIIWLAFGNPTQNTGRFRECFGKHRHLWKTHQIDSRTVEGTNREYLESLVKTYGEDSDFVRVRVRGVFPRAGVSQFIGSDLVEEAQARKVHADPGAPFILGVDIARFGDDQSVIRGRRGRDGRCVRPEKWRGMDTVFSAGKVAEAIDVLQAGRRLHRRRRRGRRRGRHPQEPRLQGQRGELRPKAKNEGDFVNKRAEMWAAAKDWLKTGQIDPDRELADDLAGPEYGFDKDGRIQLEKKADMKKRGLASPDDGDAFVLTFAEPVQRTDMRTSRDARRSRAPGKDITDLQVCQAYAKWRVLLDLEIELRKRGRIVRAPYPYELLMLLGAGLRNPFPRPGETLRASTPVPRHVLPPAESLVAAAPGSPGDRGHLRPRSSRPPTSCACARAGRRPS